MEAFTVSGGVIAASWISLVLILVCVPVLLYLMHRREMPVLIPALFGAAICIVATLFLRTFFAAVIFPALPGYDTMGGNAVLEAVIFALLTVLLEETARLLVFTQFLKPELRTRAASAAVGLGQAYTEAICLIVVGLVTNLMAYGVINAGMEDIDKETASSIIETVKEITVGSTLHYIMVALTNTVRAAGYSVFMMAGILKGKTAPAYGITAAAHFVIDLGVALFGLVSQNLILTEILLVIVSVPAGYVLYKAYKEGAFNGNKA